MAVITVNQIIDNIDSFISNIRNLSKSYYMVIGKPDAWDIDATPPAANASIQQTELSLYQDLVYGKIIDSEDISYMIRKTPWVYNTVYDKYDQNDPDLLSKDFYVVNDVGQVYKCINNGNGAPSTIKPFLSTEYGTFTTGDGYIWKYMYTVDSGANTKFASNTYIPVTVNANVESNAVPGTIDYINLTDHGTNYQVYEEGFLDSVVNTYTVQLQDTSSTYDNFYTGSSIYLKAGGGAGQIRPIVSYTGLDRSLTVDPPFDLFVNLKLANISGSITVGNKVSQNLIRMSYLYDVGSFDVGHTVVQTDTGATGVITSANSSVFFIQPSSGSPDFVQNLPVYSTSNNHTAKTSTQFTIVSGNNRATRATTGTNITTLYSANDYIRIGNSSSNQIRRVISVASTYVTVDNNTPFTANMTANSFEVNIAAAPVSIVQLQREGNIVYTNLTGQRLAISNTTPSGVGFTPGEKVNLVNASNVNQGANAIMSFSNTSTMFLTDAAGTFTSALYVLGASSNTRAYINSVVSYPNITVENPIGTFSAGQPISITTGAGTVVGNATVLAKLTTPNELTEYIISPTVTIDGDGNNAVAYAYIDESGNNINRQITSIITINPGEGYSRANVSISSNTLYGSGATAEVAVSPIAGHGANAHQELGARYAGISTTFGSGATEGYKFPLYGSYRRIGILEDPKFNDAWVTVGSFDRTTLSLSNESGTFEVGEIVIQPASNAAGVVTHANATSANIELKNVRSTFNANTRNMTFTVNTVSGVFSNGETIYQANSTPSNLAFGTIISENSSLGIMSVNLVNGAFTTFHTIVGTTSGANCSVESIMYHDAIHGLVSNATANVATANVNYFRIVEDNQQVVQLNSNSTGDLNQVVSNTLIRLTDVKGHFNANDTLMDLTTNSYANVVSIAVVNGTVDATSDFGHKFIQTTRLTTLTNTAPYTPFERVYQEVSNASGQVISTTSDIDLVLTSTNGTFSVGNELTSGAGATALVMWANNDYGANSSYLRCTSVTGNFDVGNTVINNLSVGGTVGAQYHALVVSDVYGQFEADEDVIGVDSEAQGNVSVVLYPELVKNSGQLIYTDNIVPFTRSNTSVEKINIIIKF